MTFVYGVWEPTNKLRWIRGKSGAATLQQFCVSYEAPKNWPNDNAKRVEEWRDIEVVEVDDA